MLLRFLFVVVLVVLVVVLINIAYSADHAQAPPVLQKAAIELRNKAALQRGARMYMNYCAGCHSMEYLRYSRLARDIGIVDHTGNVYTDLLMNNLIFTEAKVGDPIRIAMPPEDARQWFGVVPPDLTLAARIYGADWLYTYLMSFYQDDSRPFGSNNWLKQEVAMPNVLAILQGKQVPVFRQETISANGEEKTIEQIDHLQLLYTGSMTEQEFHAAINDLVNFLVYAGDPTAEKRKKIGLWVLLFLLITLFFIYRLKRYFWHKL